MKRSILFLIATLLANGVLGGLPIPGGGGSMLESVAENMPGNCKIQFVLHNATITGTPNEYLRTAEIIIKEGGLKADIHTDITKEYPSNIRVKVVIKYAGMEMPPMDLEACIAFYEKFFVEDVINKGKPKDKFPHECPIPPGDYWVGDWRMHPCKIPPGTPPGPVEVIVEIYIPKEATIMYLHAFGELIMAL